MMRKMYEQADEHGPRTPKERRNLAIQLENASMVKRSASPTALRSVEAEPIGASPLNSLYQRIFGLGYADCSGSLP